MGRDALSIMVLIILAYWLACLVGCHGWGRANQTPIVRDAMAERPVPVLDDSSADVREAADSIDLAVEPVTEPPEAARQVHRQTDRLRNTADRIDDASKAAADLVNKHDAAVDRVRELEDELKKAKAGRFYDSLGLIVVTAVAAVGIGVTLAFAGMTRMGIAVAAGGLAAGGAAYGLTEAGWIITVAFALCVVLGLIVMGRVAWQTVQGVEATKEDDRAWSRLAQSLKSSQDRLTKAVITPMAKKVTTLKGTTT